MTVSTVFVSAGTYHLAFDRLAEWIEPWSLRHPNVRVVMQHGPGRGVEGAENRAILPHDELLQLLRSADAVVLQGGAGGVMDARALGRIPIVVPRIPGGGEVVDDHQLLFTAEVARQRIVYRAVTADELWSLLDDALSGRIPTRTQATDPTPGTAALAALLSQPVARLATSTRLARLARLVVGRSGRRGTLDADPLAAGSLSAGSLAAGSKPSNDPQSLET
jgi:UDP-N-acetylglucosamine transferase subunit ALG13